MVNFDIIGEIENIETIASWSASNPFPSLETFSQQGPETDIAESYRSSHHKRHSREGSQIYSENKPGKVLPCTFHKTLRYLCYKTGIPGTSSLMPSGVRSGKSDRNRVGVPLI